MAYYANRRMRIHGNNLQAGDKLPEGELTPQKIEQLLRLNWIEERKRGRKKKSEEEVEETAGEVEEGGE